MAKITFHGDSINTVGDLPTIGTLAPDFDLVKSDLTELKLSSLKGKNVVLNIFPSIDTGVCATSVRKFNKEAGSLLCFSRPALCSRTLLRNRRFRERDYTFHFSRQQ